MAVIRIKSRWRNGMLEFYETSNNEVVDVMAPVKVFDDFNGLAVDNTNDWNVTAVNSGTFTADGGWGTLTTGAADDDNVEVASELVFSGANYACCEAKLRTDDIAAAGFCFGFTDAINEGADDLPMFYEGGSLTSEASDAAMFVQDSDLSAALMCTSVAGDTDTTAVASGTTMVNGTAVRLRVQLESTTAKFWVNGSHVATIASSVTAATALCVYLGFINREAAANTLDVDYIRAWGLR